MAYAGVHAQRLPERRVDRRFRVRVEGNDNHLPATFPPLLVDEFSGHNGAGDLLRSRAKRFGPLHYVTSVALSHHRHTVVRLGIPYAEQVLSVLHVGVPALPLPYGAKQVNKIQRIDVALVNATYRQVSFANQLKQVQLLIGYRPFKRERLSGQRDTQQVGLAEPGEFLRRELPGVFFRLLLAIVGQLPRQLNNSG